MVTRIGFKNTKVTKPSNCETVLNISFSSVRSKRVRASMLDWNEYSPDFTSLLTSFLKTNLYVFPSKQKSVSLVISSNTPTPSKSIKYSIEKYIKNYMAFMWKSEKVFDWYTYSREIFSFADRPFTLPLPVLASDVLVSLWRQKDNFRTTSAVPCEQSLLGSC